MDKLKEIQEECVDMFREWLSIQIHDLVFRYNPEGESRLLQMSPIEEMFATKFIARFYFEAGWFLLSNEDEKLSKCKLIVLYHQQVKGKSGRMYYPDFIFNIKKDNQLLFGDLGMLIELDGHIWHERTPEQVERDKIRERDLIDAGYSIYRFSGREVYKDVDKIIDQCVVAYYERAKNARN